MTVLRSFLFTPGNHLRRVEKAFTLGGDAVILDLEDACPVAEKSAARAIVAEALQRPRSCLGYVRVNALTTDFAFGDISGIVRTGLDGIVLPKVERPDDLRIADWSIAQFERERGLKVGAIDLIPIIETAAGLRSIHAIAASGTRAKRMAFGAGDFTLDLNLTWTPDELELLPHRSAVVLASRSAGLEPPIDTVWVNLRDGAGFARSVERARGLGFQGKMCIHPDQVPVVNSVFTPHATEIEHASRVVAAFEQAERNGSASIQLDGQFIDYPIVYRARRLLEIGERLAMRDREVP